MSRIRVLYIKQGDLQWGKADGEIGPNKCLDLDGSSQSQASAEVVVWVNEDGDTIRTETNHLPATSELHPNVRRINLSGRKPFYFSGR